MNTINKTAVVIGLIKYIVEANIIGSKTAVYRSHNPERINGKNKTNNNIKAVTPTSEFEL